jgi:hypothetical protein
MADEVVIIYFRSLPLDEISTFIFEIRLHNNAPFLELASNA